MCVPVAILVLLAGCNPRQSTWPTDRAEAECALYERCTLLMAFDDTLSVCVDQVTEQEQVRLTGNMCDYDASAAQECLDTFLSLSCDEFHGERADPTSACDRVCGDGK